MSPAAAASASAPGPGTMLKSAMSKWPSMFCPASDAGTVKPNCMFPMFEKIAW